MSDSRDDELERKAKKAAYDREYRERNSERIEARNKAYRTANKDRALERATKWYRENKDRKKAYDAIYLVANKEKRMKQGEKYRKANKCRKYGLTSEQHRQMLEACNGRCPCCKVPFSKLWESVPSVDHCHRTGVVRGIICRRCNLVIGHADDSPAILKNCLRYLEKSRVNGQAESA